MESAASAVAAPSPAGPLARAAQASDDEVVARVLAGELALFEILMRRYDQRLARVARAILGDDGDVDDVLQDAWLAAYRHLAGFEHRARFSTWLTRIAANAAFDRRRRRARSVPIDPAAAAGALSLAPADDPEQASAARELAERLERAIDALPAPYREAYVLRQVQGLDTSEAAACLALPPATLKTRLHRARALLRAALERDPDPIAPRAFPFAGARCARLVAAVLTRLRSVRAL